MTFKYVCAELESHMTNPQGERTEPHLQQVIKGEDRAQFELVKYRHLKFFNFTLADSDVQGRGVPLLRHGWQPIRDVAWAYDSLGGLFSKR